MYLNLIKSCGSDGKESVCIAGDLASIPGLRRSPWRWEWQPTPVFLPGEFHGQSSLVGYSPWGCKELDVTEHSSFQFSSVAQLCPTLCNPMDCSLCPWNSPGKNTGEGSHSLVQGIFLTQESNPSLPRLLLCRQILYH